LSSLRLFFNIWTLVAVLGYTGSKLWREQRMADEIVNGILANNPRQKFEGFWTLASLGSDRIARNVFDRLLSNPIDAAILERVGGSALASLGLRSNSWKMSGDLLTRESCVNEAVSFCSSLADLSGKNENFADRILAQMQQTTDHNALFS